MQNMYKTIEKGLAPQQATSGEIETKVQIGKDGEIFTTEESIEMSEELKKYDGPFAYVGCHAGFVVNMGNYQTARIEVTCTLPCNPENKENVFEEAKKFCEDRVKKEVVQLEAKKSSNK